MNNGAFFIFKETKMMSFDFFIKKKRIKAGITQRKIAEETGYSVPFVGAWEQGKCYPPKKVLPKLAKLLETDVEEIEKEILKCKFEKLKRQYGQES